MNCPVDGSTLALSERNGIEIDYCPQCRGVWLDRGELDKILDRASDSAGYGQSAGYDQPPAYGGGHHGSSGHGGGHHGSSGYGQNGRRRRGGWLGELFD